MRVSSNKQREIAEQIEDSTFKPQASMKEVKAKLLIGHSDDPREQLSDISLERAVQLTGDNRLRNWWSQPGFREWLVNQDEYRHKILHLAGQWLDVAQTMMTEFCAEPDPKWASSMVNLGKVLAELARLNPRQKEIQVVDEQVRKMDKHQLEQFIKKQYKLHAGGRSGDEAKESVQNSEDQESLSNTQTEP